MRGWGVRIKLLLQRQEDEKHLVRSGGFPDSSVGKEATCNAGGPSEIPGSGRPSILQLPCGSAGKESACNAGDLGLIPVLGWSPGEGWGYPLQYPGLENSRGCIVPGSQRVGHDWVTFTFTFTEHTGILTARKEPEMGKMEQQLCNLLPEHSQTWKEVAVVSWGATITYSSETPTRL